MSTVTAYAATSATEPPLTKTTVTRREVGAHDVKFDIHFAGICHSDIHTVRGEWGGVRYPLVPGHEIAGVVTEVGSDVTKYKVGDRVGVGCFVDSCRECDSCKAGLQQYCTGSGMVGTYGSVGKDGQPPRRLQRQHRRRRELCAAHPPRFPLVGGRRAADVRRHHHLLPPLRHWNAGPGKRIAVVGLGGLGHMGVKLGVAMGAEVTVLSQSLKKMEDGLRLGAGEYYATSDPPETFTKLRNSFDLILNTVSANLDLSAYLSTLRVDGTLVELGMPEQPMVVPAQPLVSMRRHLSGSMIGGIPETRRCWTSAPRRASSPKSS